MNRCQPAVASQAGPKIMGHLIGDNLLSEDIITTHFRSNETCPSKSYNSSLFLLKKQPKYLEYFQ